MSRCVECQEEIEDWDNTIGYDQLPHHKSCIKQKYREDNPQLSEDKYEDFDKRVDTADQIVKDGEGVRFIVHDNKPCPICEGSGTNPPEDPCLTCGGSGVV